MHDLVSTEWLAGALGAPDLMVFDATKYLPNEPFDDLTKYREAHIPGARFFDIDVVADPDTNLPHMAPTAGRFARLMGEMGISNATRVIFYDQKGLQSSARGWWLMKLFGHEKAAVLDGGLPKWLAEGRATESGDAKPAAPSSYTPDFRADLVKGIGDVKRIIAHGGALILDARAKGRFDGTAPEPRPGLPSGHMPGAKSVPFNELLNADFTMKDPAALRARFDAAGADGSKPVVTSCGTGVTACILALGLKQAGLGDAAIYDGSWTEWAGRPETQKEKSS
ncbi:MAG: sulfurtransferase [Roseomonas sp.]|nr:sulfurtransferase [Roseomonas sp.]MCA3327170.1 sulfurtransferase [Roseomonas sp.]MCA3331980.1 sulfurtransferase [Roseomonas sp.]MCA3334628.1 sulfurtransferase [Roseomonas sp.]MCA3348881.1 sulfurtransferase [Roseomonas sp.]